MNRHPFRWDALVFGLIFLAVLSLWAILEQDMLDPDDLAYAAAAVLIVLGVVGILATAISARSPRTAPFTPEPIQSTDDESTTPAEAPAHGQQMDTEETRHDQ